MFYCVSIMMLGYTRTNGVVAYDSSSKGFEEITPATARQLISKGLIKGIKWKNNDDKGEFVCDTEGWNQQNLPIKTACGKFRPMLNDIPGVPINSMCTVVRVLDTNYRGRLYEIVTNKCVRIKIDEKALRELNSISPVAGVWITDNEVRWIDGVEYEDRRARTEESISEEDIQTGAEEPKEDILTETEESTPEEVAPEEVAPEEPVETQANEPQTMEELFGTSDNFMQVPDENAEGMMPPVFEEESERKEEQQPEEQKAKKIQPKRKRK